MHCFKTKGLADPWKAKEAEKPAKAATLSEIMRGVRSNSPDEPHPDDALDRLMNEAFEDGHKQDDGPGKKEAEKYSLAWFATGAQWQLG
jgi:hypothetical protein